VTWRPVGLSALALAVTLAPTSACSSKDDAATGPARRACGLRIWHRPASAEAHVEIVGAWNGFARPGTIPARTADGWRVADLSPPPGEHAYAIVEDGVWLIDRNAPMTAEHEGREVSLAVVPDCELPELRIDAVEPHEAGATVRATFFAGRGGSALDPGTIEPPELRVVSADRRTGAVVLEVDGLSRGKYTYVVRARDGRGEVAEARATIWLDGRSAAAPWDPRDAIVYQVFVDRFRGTSGPLAPPETPAARAGGTLAGVRAALDSGELTSLGVDTLWLSPLYANPTGEYPGNDGRQYTSYHGYWPVASRALDPRFATEEELDAFMADAHARGIRVLFDVVPNHVHQDHPLAAEHPDWFGAPGCICGQGACDWADHIKTCWFAPYLPDFDWSRKEVAAAVTEDVVWWFDRFGADGVRIDAVPMTPRSATRRIATAIRSRYEHPGNTPYILGENFTGPGGFGSLRYDLGPYGLDGSFHFPLMWTLRETIAEERAPMRKIDADFRAGEKEWDGAGAVMGLMIGNHDVSRFASVSAGNAMGDTWLPPPQPIDPLVYAKQRVALAAVLTLPGAPVIYYGDEVGLAGRSDPDCRRVMPAEAELLPAQIETREVARNVGRTRSCSAALRRGRLETLVADEESWVFARVLDGEAPVVVALTRRPKLPITVALPSGTSPSIVDVVSGARVEASGGSLEVPADAFGVHVYVAAEGGCAAPR